MSACFIYQIISKNTGVQAGCEAYLRRRGHPEISRTRHLLTIHNAGHGAEGGDKECSYGDSDRNGISAVCTHRVPNFSGIQLCLRKPHPKVSNFKGHYWKWLCKLLLFVRNNSYSTTCEEK